MPIGAFVSSLIFDILAFATARTHLTLNAAAAVLFAVGYALRVGDHVALDKTRGASSR